MLAVRAGSAASGSGKAAHHLVLLGLGGHAIPASYLANLNAMIGTAIVGGQFFQALSARAT